MVSPRLAAARVSAVNHRCPPACRPPLYQAPSACRLPRPGAGHAQLTTRHKKPRSVAGLGLRASRDALHPARRGSCRRPGVSRSAVAARGVRLHAAARHRCVHARKGVALALSCPPLFLKGFFTALFRLEQIRRAPAFVERTTAGQDEISFTQGPNAPVYSRFAHSSNYVRPPSPAGFFCRPQTPATAHCGSISWQSLSSVSSSAVWSASRNDKTPCLPLVCQRKLFCSSSAIYSAPEPERAMCMGINWSL